jgi:hypothetical protein
VRKLFDVFRVVFLGFFLYTFSVIATVMSVLLGALVAAVFVMFASSYAFQHTDGVFPDLGYRGSLALSFILILTCYIGVRGASRIDK